MIAVESKATRGRKTRGRKMRIGWPCPLGGGDGGAKHKVCVYTEEIPNSRRARGADCDWAHAGPRTGMGDLHRRCR